MTCRHLANPASGIPLWAQRTVLLLQSRPCVVQCPSSVGHSREHTGWLEKIHQLVTVSISGCYAIFATHQVYFCYIRDLIKFEGRSPLAFYEASQANKNKTNKRRSWAKSARCRRGRKIANDVSTAANSSFLDHLKTHYYQYLACA